MYSGLGPLRDSFFELREGIRYTTEPFRKACKDTIDLVVEHTPEPVKRAGRAVGMYIRINPLATVSVIPAAYLGYHGNPILISALPVVLAAGFDLEINMHKLGKEVAHVKEELNLINSEI